MNPIDLAQFEGMTANLVSEVKALREALEAVTFEVETYNIDWARLQAGSPDYDPKYKPHFPTCVIVARELLPKPKS